jgi:hypothetical protein
MGAPDSPVCHWTGTVVCPVCRHVTQPLGFGSSRLLAPLSSCGTGQSGATPASSCLLSGAPLTLPRTIAHCLSVLQLLQSTVARSSRCSAGAPDSPVIFSGVRLLKPAVAGSALYGSGALDTVQWHTGQSGAPDYNTLGFNCSFEFDP